ncbi:MAG: carboxyl transferase domain-containing protein, partial [Dehalococcoidia bacterium]|nr:carboxyl transferase domain-containing protein [Dehalococcoidia bacterium]
SSGVIPQNALVMGPCLGAAALSASLSDFVFMVQDASFYAAPPGKEEALQSNARVHARQSGCCDVLAKNDEECLSLCRELLSYLPQNNTSGPPLASPKEPVGSKEELMELVPVEPYKWFDMRKVVKAVMDGGEYFETKKDFAQNLTTGFARLGGQIVGIIGNNSIWRGGCHDVDASDKHARFTRFCDAFNIPIIYFADSPAFYPSLDEERRGILRHGTKVIHSTAEATVPKITLYIRKCYGGGQIAMPGNWMLADRAVAWPSVERGLMGPQELVSILWRKPIQEAKTPEEQKAARDKGVRIMEKAIERFTRTSSEEFIDPRETRSFLLQALKSLENKNQGGNME